MTAAKTGRPPLAGGRATTVKILLPDDMLTAIDAAAERQGVSRAEWIRRACAAELKDQ